MPLRPARHQPWLVASRAAAAALLAAGVALVLSAAGMGSGTPDEYFGLPDDTGREEVMAYCGACHSMKLVVQQGLTRADWAEVLVEMYEEQDMEVLEKEDAKLILDYLAKHIGPENRKRRLEERGIIP